MEVKFKKDYCSDLLSWKEFETLVNIRPLMTSRRVNFFNQKPYRWDCPSWGLDVNAIPPTIIKEALFESVCYFRDMSRATENINQFAKTLEEEYKSVVDAHVYVCLNLKPDHPFGKHHDVDDNVIVQCEGETNFKVWDTNDQQVLDVNLTSGDTIWIPKLYPHLATSHTKRLSVSFPVMEGNDLCKEDREWIKL